MSIQKVENSKLNKVIGKHEKTLDELKIDNRDMTQENINM